MFLTACNVGPDYQQPEIYPPETIVRELNLYPTMNVNKIQSPQITDRTLNRLIALGLENNTDLKTAVSRLQQARLTMQINRADYLPQIGVKSGYNYEKSSHNVGLAADSHYYTAGFDASWELDLWGKGRRQTEADTATVNAMEYTLDNVRLSVVAEIARNYINLLQNRENLRFAKQNKNLQQDITATVRAKYESGLSDETAYEQAVFLQENTEAQISEYKQAIENYENALATIIGVLPSRIKAESSAKSGLFTVKLKDVSEQMRTLPATVVRLRPDVAAAEQKLIAENALVGKAVAEMYPDASLSGLWGYMAQGGSKLIRSSSQTYNYAPVITLPLLDWNKLWNAIKIQESVREEAFLNYQQTVIAAIAEIKNTLNAYHEVLNTAQHKRQALQNMQNTMQLVRKKYENGLIEFSEVLNTQQNLIDAQEDYIASRAAVLLNLIAYSKAVGVSVNSN